MHGERRAVAAVAAILALTAACASPGLGRDRDASPTASATDRECADLIVLGVRGQGQSRTANGGLGKEVLATSRALVRRLHDRSDATVDVQPVPYPARPPATLAEYTEDVRAGARMVRERLDGLVDRCPDSAVALIGFSEGAQVVHSWAADVPRAAGEAVVLVAMIADPSRDPADRIASWDYGVPASGPGMLGPGRRIDDDVRDVAISLCLGDDEVCNGDRPRTTGTRNSAIHRTYYEKPATAAKTAARVDAILRTSWR